jgi:uncharacterized oxidoreductase
MTTRDADHHHVLITGGSQGIGLGLATRYLAQGATVLITGRSPDRLATAAAEHPGLRTFVNDIGHHDEREALTAHVRATMPEIDVLINNAGIQRRVAVAADHADWDERQAEINILLSGPVDLNHLLIPTLLAHGGPATIVNVTSGGALVPQPFAPLYSACKAALHSYTTNLRYALAATTCRVVELIPPAVATGLAGDNEAHGADLDTFCDTVFATLLATDQDTVGYGMTDTPQIKQLLQDTTALFDQLAGRFPTPTY